MSRRSEKAMTNVAQMAVDMVVKLGRECERLERERGTAVLLQAHDGKDPRMTATETYKTGDRVRAFDPRTLGVVKHATVVKIGRKYATLDFGLTGSCRVRLSDILGLAN